MHGSMTNGTGMWMAMWTMMGASTLLLLALTVASVLGIIWLARRLSPHNAGPQGAGPQST